MCVEETWGHLNTSLTRQLYNGGHFDGAPGRKVQLVSGDYIQSTSVQKLLALLHAGTCDMKGEHGGL